MNKVTIQIAMLAACATLANPVLRADEPLKFTPMSEIVEQTLRPVSPHDACGDELYKLARLAREAQSNADGSTHMRILDKQFNKCLSQHSERLFGKDNDPKALARCLNKSSAAAAAKNDPETGYFLTQHILTRKLGKGGPTVSFTLDSPLYGLIGAVKGGAAGATVGAFLGAYSATEYSKWANISKTVNVTTTDSAQGGNNAAVCISPNAPRVEGSHNAGVAHTITTSESTTTRGPNPLDARTGAKIGAGAGWLLGTCAGFMIGGVKISLGMR